MKIILLILALLCLASCGFYPSLSNSLTTSSTKSDFLFNSIAVDSFLLAQNINVETIQLVFIEEYVYQVCWLCKEKAKKIYYVVRFDGRLKRNERKPNHFISGEKFRDYGKMYRCFINNGITYIQPETQKGLLP